MKRLCQPWLAYMLVLAFAVVGCARRGTQAEVGGGPKATGSGSPAGAQRSDPAADAIEVGRRTADSLLATLPRFDQLEWGLVAFAATDPDLTPSISDLEAALRESDAGELFDQLGLTCGQVLEADWVLELSAAEPPRDCILWRWESADTLQEVHEGFRNKTGKEPKPGHEKAITLSGAPRGWVATFCDNTLVMGGQASVRQVSSALSGQQAAQDTMRSDKTISDIWDSLPAGFSMSVGQDNEHSYVADLTDIRGWGESTAKASPELQRCTFVASCASPEAAATAERHIVDSLGPAVEDHRAEGSQVIVVYTESLASPF